MKNPDGKDPRVTRAWQRRANRDLKARVGKELANDLIPTSTKRIARIIKGGARERLWRILDLRINHLLGNRNSKE